jgi:hypothetical protein
MRASFVDHDFALFERSRGGEFGRQLADCDFAGGEENAIERSEDGSQ